MCRDHQPYAQRVRRFPLSCPRRSSTTSAWRRRCARISTARRASQSRPHFEAPEMPREIPAPIQTACFRHRAGSDQQRGAARPRRAFVAAPGLTAAPGSSSRVAMTAAASISRRARRRAAGASLGLAGMEERVALAGGSSSCARRPDKARIADIIPSRADRESTSA